MNACTQCTSVKGGKHSWLAFDYKLETVKKVVIFLNFGSYKLVKMLRKEGVHVKVFVEPPKYVLFIKIVTINRFNFLNNFEHKKQAHNHPEYLNITTVEWIDGVS